VSSEDEEDPRVIDTSRKAKIQITESKRRVHTKSRPGGLGPYDPQIVINSKKRLQLRDFGGSHHHQHHRLTHLHGKQHPTTEEQRKQTVFSDWGDAYYDGVESMRLSNPIRSMQQRSADLSFFSDSDWRRSSGPTAIVTGAKMTLPSGHVMVMQLVKGGQCFNKIDINSSLQQVVDTFLSLNSGGVALPVSYNESDDTRPKMMKQSRMAMTLRENLGPNFDPKLHGLTFSVGPLNSKLCHKMTVCDLGQLQKIFSLTHGTKCETLTNGGKCESLNLVEHPEQ